MTAPSLRRLRYSLAVKLVLCLSLVHPAPASARSVVAKPSLGPDSELFVEVRLDDRTVVSPAMLIFPFLSDWVLPIGELSEALGFALTVAPSLTTVDGYLLDPSRRFFLDRSRCEVSYDGKTESFECSDVAVYGDDILVSRRLLERWLPIGIQVYPYRSRVIVVPREKLPLQGRSDREREAERLKPSGGERKPLFPMQENSGVTIEGPVIDEELSFSYDSHARRYGFTTQTMIAGETLGWEAQSIVSATERGVQGFRATFSRHDPDGGLLGPLKSTEVQLFDVNLPVVSLVSSASQGRGALLSSFPLNAPNTFDSTSLVGSLPLGWDVELYRNGLLVDRRAGDSTGQYLFETVPLLYGINTFRLAFYGPRGERRDEYRNYQVLGNPLQPGKSAYRAGYATLRDGRQRFVGEVAHTFHRSFSLRAGVQSDLDRGRSFGFVGASSANDFLFVGAQCAFATRGGEACELAPQLAIAQTTLGSRFLRLHDYRSDAYNAGDTTRLQTSGTEAFVTAPVLTSIGLLADLRYLDNRYSDGTRQRNLRSRLALNQGNLYVSNETSRSLDVVPAWRSRFDAQYNFPSLRFRLGTGLASDTGPKSAVELVEVETQWRPISRFSLSNLLRHRLTTSDTEYVGRLSWQLPKATVGVSWGEGTSSAFTLGLFLTFSVAREPEEGSWHLTSERIAAQGLASAIVCLDVDLDERCGPTERRLEGMIVAVNPGDSLVRTDANGIAWLRSLPSFVPVNVVLSEQSFTRNPFWRSGKQGISFVPRPGKTARLEFPVIVAGEVDGVILLSGPEGKRAKRGVPVELVDERGEVRQTLRTDREGAFTFLRVVRGKYRVRVSAEWLAKDALAVEPAEREVVMSETGAFETGVDFTLRPPQ